MSMDVAPTTRPRLVGRPTQADAPSAGTMEANALREFLADTAWGALDVLVLDLPPGTDRLATVVSLVPGLSGTVLVTIPSDLSQLIVKKSITVARGSGAPVLGLVENMAGLFPGPDAATLARDADIPFLGGPVRSRAGPLRIRGDRFVNRADRERPGAARVAGRCRDLDTAKDSSPPDTHGPRVKPGPLRLRAAPCSGPRMAPTFRPRNEFCGRHRGAVAPLRRDGESPLRSEQVTRVRGRSSRS